MSSQRPIHHQSGNELPLPPNKAAAYSVDVEFQVLGPLQVTQDGSPVSLGGTKQRTVLALLLASNGQPVSTDRLIEGVYGDEAPDGVRRSIQTFISNLRGLCGEMIERRGDGYVLDASRNSVDALRFEDVVAMARLDEDPHRAAQSLREVLALWRGHPYSDIDAHGLLETDIARLTEMRIEALGHRIDADLAAGRHAAIASELASLSGEYPLREHFRAQQMVALYRSGRQAEALRACNTTRSYLAEELGIELSDELRDLEQRILEQDPTLAAATSTEVHRIAVLAVDLSDPASLARLTPDDRSRVVETQERIINDAAVDGSGRVFAHRGSAIYASFGTVQSAVDSAALIQQDLAAAELPDAPVGIGVDIGDVETRDGGDVVGPPVTRTAALVGAAHGGQVLLSAEAHHALTDDGAAGWVIRGLGSHQFAGLGSPQVVYQLVLPGRAADFPELRTDAVPAPMPMSARGIPGYELRAEIGSGPFGVVHRAYQSSVGREVAVKIIQPGWANHPAFLRRFEVEAQLVARLEHPHIVPLYDYWRDPNGAILVMRWMRGGTLKQRLTDGAMTVAATERLLSQIGPALGAAHRNGVVHGDLKPTNVLFDEDDNAYLSDFAIVTGLDGGALSVGADISALGLVAQKCLTAAGDPPGETPKPIVDMLDRATADDPADRYADVEEFMTAWVAAQGTTDDAAASRQRTAARNPYKGLRPFDEPDADDFYGREQLVGRLADAVASRRLVAAIGPSGIGKSSVVRAGLIPALRRGVVAGSEEWLITTMTPGRNAFAELAAALTRVSVTVALDLEDSLRSKPLSFGHSAQRLLPRHTNLLLVIDQFEELFTLVDSEEERTVFLDLLAGIAAAEEGQIRVVLTMRADYMDRPLRYAGFAEHLRQGVVLVAAPSDTNIRSIIEEPARAVGVRFENGLVDRIVDDVRDEPGSLPLLEFSLAELFDQRDMDLVTEAKYDGTGGVLEAIGRRAEALYQALDPVSQETARQLFLRLVTVGETHRDTRRRVSITEFHRLGINDDAVESVLDAFGRHRLLTFDRDFVTRAPTVDVAHEAILTEWSRLQQWIEEHRDGLLLRRRLTAAVVEWDESGQDPGYLLSGGRLEQFETWASATDMAITTTEREFLEASRTQVDELRTKRTRRRRSVLGGFAGAAVVALILVAAALYQSNLRASEAAENHARELAAGAMVQLDSDPELSILLSLEAISATPDPQREAIEALHTAVLTSRSEFVMAWPEAVPFTGKTALTATKDGIVAVTGDGGIIALHDGSTGSRLGLLEPAVPALPDWMPFDGPIIDANPVTGEIAAVYGDHILRVWDPNSGRLVWSENTAADPSSTVLPPAGGRTTYSPDGRWLAVTTYDVPSALSVWDATAGEQLWVQEVTEPQGPIVASFSPSGDELAIAWWLEEDSGTGQVVVLDRATGTEQRRVDPHVPIGSIAWSPDGTQILHGSEAGGLLVWSADTLEPVTVRTEHSGSVEAIVYSADGSLLATSGGGSITIWATDPLDPFLVFPTPVGGVPIALAPDGARLFTAQPDGAVRAWNIQPEGRGEHMAAAPSGSVLGVDVDASGEQLVARSIGGEFNPAGVTAWNSATGSLLYNIDGLNDFAFGGVTYLAAGERFAVQAFVNPTDETEASYGPIQIRDAADGTVLLDLEASDGFDRQQLTVSADGRYLASGGTFDQPDEFDGHGSASIYDLATGGLLHRLPHPAMMVTGTAFSPDGSLLATATCGPGSLSIWDWEQETLLQETAHSDCNSRSAFSPTAPIVAVADVYAPTLVWDVEAGREAYTLAEHAGAAFSVTFSPDGERIATAGMDGTMRIWDAADGSELLAVSLSAVSLGDVAFFPDGDRIAVASFDGSLWVLTLDTDDLADIATSRLTRTLTPDECARYHIDSCPA